MDIKNPNRISGNERGGTSVYVLVILVPVLLGFMGFAVDLGQLYLVRGELKNAANSMALAAAAKLIGTDVSTADATTAGRLTINNASGFGNKYYFGGFAIGDSNGDLTSDVPDPTYYQALGDATGANDGATEAASSDARHAKVTITADAPLTLWSLLSLGQARKTSIRGSAVAGMSAPLCTACGIEPIAIAALDASDTTDFGLVKGSRYTFGYQCTGPPTPGILSSSVQRLEYLLLNRLNAGDQNFPDENTQLYRIGAQGLPGNTDPTIACVQINAQEQVWASAPPQACATNTVATPVSSFLCGLATRFDPSVATGCTNVPDVDTLSSAYTADSDLTDLDDYTQYIGSKRRIITVPVVDTLSASGTMTVLGFRQFLVDPALGTTALTVTDANARFSALYVGYPVALRQGSFSGCSITAGPGKVVLHQ